MASLTISVSEEFKNELKIFSWVNWSELAREEVIKKVIFENYLKTGSLTDEEWEFCNRIDWHPVDELPLKEELKKEIEKRKKEQPLRYKSVDDFFKRIKEK